MRRLTILLVGAMLAVAGCGGDDESSSSGSSDDGTPTATETATPTATEAASGGGGENLALAADASALKFDKSALSAKPGKVTITMDNPSDIPHAVAIEGNGVDVDGKTVGKGEKSIASRRPQAGHLHVLLPRPRPRGGRHEGQAHGEVSRAGTACAR